MTNNLNIWTQQLYKSFASISYCYRITLPIPVIQIVDSQSYWGQFDPTAQKIKISAALVQNYSWDIVEKILKHELAHYIALTLFEVEDGHGPWFQKACAMIGVPTLFRQATIDLGGEIDLTTAQQQTPLARRIAKLMSLSSSDNEHEAFQAMKKVKELVQEATYQPETLEAGIVSVVIGTGRRRTNKCIDMICSILTGHYLVSIVHSEMYDASRLETLKTVVIFGTPANVLMAEHVYSFLLGRIQSLWVAFQKQSQCKSSKDKSSFQIGVLIGFRKKLDSMVQSVTTENALVVREESLRNNAVKLEFPRLSKRSLNQTNVNSTLFLAGSEQGKQIVISKVVTEQQQKGKFLT